MKEQQIDLIAGIISDALDKFYKDLNAARCDTTEFTTAYINLIGITLETISMNTSPVQAMSLAVEVLKRFADSHEGINLMVDTREVPKRGQMS